MGSMTGAGRYAELAAAVRTFKAELVKPSQIERMVESGSLPETVTMLTGGSIPVAESADIVSVETFLTERVIELTKRLTAYAPYDSRFLIGLFGQSHELACVKEILRAIADQSNPEDAAKLVVPAGMFSLEKIKELIESRNMNRVIDGLEDEGLKRFVAGKITGEQNATATVAAIDQYYYSRLWSASNLPDPLDAQSARSIIGEFIDQLNILLAFRARLLNLDARSSAVLFIPVNFALGHVLDELAESTSVQNLLRVLDKTPYGRALAAQSAISTDVGQVERLLNRSHAASCLNAFAGSPFNVGLALAFLFLKNYELRDMFTVISGKSNNIPTERIVDSLILGTPQT